MFQNTFDAGLWTAILGADEHAVGHRSTVEAGGFYHGEIHMGETVLCFMPLPEIPRFLLIGNYF